MSIIIFIIILGVLIFVHELGHFLVAKKSGIRVDEFAIGFPPRLWSTVKGGTRYALNLIPFGGYVKIFGEDINDEAADPNAKDSFVNKSKWIQFAVLVAGVTFNIIFAWILFSISIGWGGILKTVSNEEYLNIPNQSKTGVFITEVVSNTPAEKAGVPANSKIISIQSGENKINFDQVTPEGVQEFIKKNQSISLTLETPQSAEPKEFFMTPDEVGDGNKIVGIKMSSPIAKIEVPFYMAPIHALDQTWNILVQTTFAFGRLLGDTFTGQASMDSVAGPVGIVGLVGKYSKEGLISIIDFTAMISINLAILNILPFPALDGGRIAMVVYEGITRRKIRAGVANTINAIGFLILIGLMIFITVNDVFRLF